MDVTLSGTTIRFEIIQGKDRRLPAGAQLFAALEATDVDSLCVEAGACPVAHRLPALPPHLRAAVLNISSRAANDEDACNTCKLVVMEMAALLADPVQLLPGL